MKKSIIGLIAFAFVLTSCGEAKKTEIQPSDTELSFSFDELNGNRTVDAVSGKEYKIDYVFEEANADKIFKAPSDPLLKNGVKGKALYMDGFSTRIRIADYTVPDETLTLSAWIAPRVFENLAEYDASSPAGGHTRLTSVLNQGDLEMGEGFVFGYGRLGLWGIQLALHNRETGEDYVVGYYDPLHALPLYEWSFISASFNGKIGYISLSYNGEPAYEAVIPELANTEIILSNEPLYMGYYCNPMVEFGIDRQMPSGLIDEVEIRSRSLSPKEVRDLYAETSLSGHPQLGWEDIALDASVYDGDRYRPQYHALPPAVWMNEPHSPFYYKGKYHVFYQHNPSGPYWSQIRWGHLVSDDMIHWEYVKDAVVPTKGICPQGVWTGGACIGPDGVPWLVITAGTNTSTWSGQNIAFAHAKNPDDPYLTDWEIEDTVVLTQPSDDSQGERDQFRDPFIWFDDGVYYLLVSTSVPGRGGSANIYTSVDMRDWDYRGYLYECDYDLYPEQGAHWECVTLLPISTKDGSKMKWILFDCPQYTVEGYVVDCYYWIGEFDKNTCRFIPDDDRPVLFDRGRNTYTGQNGYCFLTEEDIASGKTAYEQGRTVLYAIAQGKAAGTAQNEYAGWAHNFAMPLELYLSDDGSEVIREPIREIASLYGETLYAYQGDGMSCEEINGAIADIRGDMLEIEAKFTLDPKQDDYAGGIAVRYNPNEDLTGGYEKTLIAFSSRGVYVDRLKSTLYDYVEKSETYTWESRKREYDVRILLDRSMLEIYIDGIMSFTTRIYPKYADSDYLRFFDENSGISVKSLTIRKMKGAYTDDVVPAYYGNTGTIMEDFGL